MKKLALLFIFATSFAAFADTPIKDLNVTNTADIESGATLTFKAGSHLAPQPTVTISGTSIDWSLSNSFAKTLSANTTFTFSTTVDDHPIDVAITNTASNYTVTWPTNIIWATGSQPTQTTGVKTDIWTFKRIGNVIYGFVVQNLVAATPTPSPSPTPSPTPPPSPTPTPTASPSPTPTPTPTLAPGGIAGLKLWLKADSLGLSNNAAVASWTDSSGTSNTATQGTGGNQPIFKTNIINSLPVVRFDATDDYMTFPNDPGEPTTTFVVGAINVSPGSLPAYAQFVITSSAVNGLRICARLSTTNWGSYSQAANFSAGEDLVSGAFNVLELTANTVDSKLYRNGTLKASVGFAIYGSGTSNIVGDPNGLNSDIAEIIIYDTVLSAPNRVAIEQYLATKYGL